jgi:sulfate adenylyltransferase subunit 2
MRDSRGQCSNPVLLFSGGKDSICLLTPGEKAFRPGRFPFHTAAASTPATTTRKWSAFRDKRAPTGRAPDRPPRSRIR